MQTTARKFGDIPILRWGAEIEMVGSVYLDHQTGEEHILAFPNQLVNNSLEMTEEDWEKLIAQTDNLETEILAKENGNLVKTIIRKSTRQIDLNTSWKVYRRDAYRCRYCWRDDVPLTVDHLALWEEGGPSIEDNLVSACKKCNKSRGNMKYEDWLDCPKYREVSKNLPAPIKQMNLDLVATLDKIPRKIHVKSR